MPKIKKNSLQVIQDPDPEDITDWIRDIATGMGLCERVFKKRCDFRMNEEMEAQTEYIRKCRGGLTFGEYVRRLILEDIAKFNLKKEGRKDGTGSEH
jgi:hypothetical protein